MTKTLQFDPHRLYFIPLGGSGEIGMNLNVYAYGGKLLVVDVGVTFEKLPGVEVVMPHVSWLRKQKKHIAGIVLTHAHEDHIGAIGHLWPDLEAPLYATPFTSQIIKHKLREARVRAPLHEVPLSSEVALGPFRVGFISLTHSIPEPSALAIQTEAGIVVHTGDWKIDANPLVGEATNQEALQAVGDAGVLGVVCDSTCVFEKGWSGSEKTVQDALVHQVSSITKGRVVIACFASNVARLVSCFEAAKKSGRSIVLAGRSLERMEAASRETDYLDDNLTALTPKEGKGLAADKTLIVATGSQGEPKAALRRMAEGHHPFLKLDAGDTVIFSSRIIPGNEKEIFALQNKLTQKGVRVITPKDVPDIHVSGHPSCEELKQMYAWTRPKNVIPVHGEDRHLEAHKQLAHDLGIASIAPHNGDVILFDAKEGPKKVGHVPTGRVGLDGSRLISMDNPLLSQRTRLSHDGVVLVSGVFHDDRLEALKVHTVGLFCSADHKDDATHELSALVKRTLGHMSAKHYDDPDKMQAIVAKEVRSYCYDTIGKRPLVVVHVLT
ncbi:ribonuclease J [bacterium NHP-B]|nr:ribonuclease J [bacterium NHP-B]